ncbi:hypothetical protein BaRGS_00004155 [Batillaria attramentaria]|uniref:Uncharacterized protein n=1 Tax=Batillaria attramentaria TaxID=370345 RepID=A0ABD0M064_9CAEN
MFHRGGLNFYPQHRFSRQENSCSGCAPRVTIRPAGATLPARGRGARRRHIPVRHTPPKLLLPSSICKARPYHGHRRGENFHKDSICFRRYRMKK